MIVMGTAQVKKVNQNDRMNIRLSERLLCICRMVTPGLRVADVGCDHGFVPVWLVQNGICPHVLAMDVGKGPLSMAGEHIRESGLEGYIETRLSDGLDQFCPGEAQCLICAGMGGMLMKRILEKAGGKLSSFQEFILQPQSDLYEFRRFLRGIGLAVTEEYIVKEEGKYYFPMKAVHADAVMYEDAAVSGVMSSELSDRFGGRLLSAKDPLLFEYLIKMRDEKNAAGEEIRAALKKRDSVSAREGFQRICGELSLIEEALQQYGGGDVYINDQR